MKNEFEEIIDEAEKNIKDPHEILAFVAVCLKNKPKMRIQEILELKKTFDRSQKTSSIAPIANKNDGIGPSRAERRAMERRNKKKGKK